MSTLSTKLIFFTPGDEAHKHRRNLLLAATLCIVHFYVKPITSLKIFDVTFDASFLNFGLTAALLWFGANYFYYLYSDYMQWKAKHMVAEQTHIMPPGRVYASYLPAMVHAANGDLHLQMLPGDSSALYVRPPATTDVNALEMQLREVVERIVKDYRDGFVLDSARIDAFNNAILRYHFANRSRFYVLDVGIPLAMMLGSFIMAILKIFICPVWSVLFVCPAI